MHVDTSLTKLLRFLWQHLGVHRQRQYIILFGLMLVSAVAEMVSLGAILPFLAVLVSPDDIFTFPFMNSLGQMLNITDAHGLILPIVIIFAVMAVVAGSIRLLYLWISIRLALATGSDLSVKVYQKTLYQPFSTHVSRNSSEVVSGIISKVHFVVFGVLIPTLTLISSSVLFIAITVMLFFLNPLVSVVIVVSFGGCYGAVALISRYRLKRNSQIIAKEQTNLVKALQEGLGGIRDVLLNDLQPLYCEIYRKADLSLRKAEADVAFVGQSPRYIMEATGLVLISILAYVLSQSQGGIESAVPVLGVFALGAQRLLPVLQQGYNAWASIVGSHSSLIDTIELLEQPLSKDQIRPLIENLSFQKSIQVNAVKFRYADEKAWVLNDITFNIQKGMRIGFVGTTGSGKSTLLDLIMGLLTPCEGVVLVDGNVIAGQNVRAWQKHIAHVPQDIFLADATIAENIAFGFSKDEIDWELLSYVAKQAQIEGFIESDLGGYSARVGERGVQLSGGQRQRVGIARALYKQASVLVFDEATSALDNKTEHNFMEAIFAIDRNITMLFVAHRISTVKNCDILIELDKGEVKASGTYEELLKVSSSFKQMAEMGNTGYE